MSFPLIFRVRDPRRAFTLIELLTVMAIVGILTAITLGTVGGIRERAKISLCRTELATIAAALESYKRQYGDYPQISSTASHVSAFAIPTTPTSKDSAYDFFRALVGRIGPTGKVISRVVSGAPTDKYGKAFLEPSKFKLERSSSADKPIGENPLPEAAVAGSDPDFVNAILDPWGNRYVYFYKEAGGNSGNWKNSTYVLMSAGPDGHIKWDSVADPIPANGIIGTAFYTETETTGAEKGKGNPDNIYTNR
jgi:prepilin-type N-terminal cleavage/methylation domain-containing protein